MSFRNLMLALCLLFVASVCCVETASAAQADELQQRQLLQLVQETNASLQDSNWLRATQQFDAAWSQVCFGEDPVLMLSNEGQHQLVPGQSEQFAGGRARLEHLFRTAPPEFREEYDRQFGKLSEDQFSQAVAAEDAKALRRCAQRYPFTPVAQRALLLLVRRAIDRGELLNAALDHGKALRLAQHSGATPAELQALQLRHALLLWRADLDADATSLVRQMRAVSPDGRVSLGTVNVTLPLADEDVREWLATMTVTGERMPEAQWIQPLGTYRRVRNQPHGPVQYDEAWSSDLFVVNDVLFGEQLNPILGGVPERLRLLAALKTLENGTVYPASCPLVVDGRVIFRTPAGLRSVAASDGELIWEITTPDSRLRQAMAATSRRDQPESNVRLAAVQNNLADEFLNQLTRSCTDGQMSTDGKTLYVVEDSVRAGFGRLAGPGFGSGPTGLPSNFIRAYDVESGILKWEAGGQRAVNLSPNLLAGFYFLGTPLILDDRCYVLAENGDGIYLLQLAGPATNGQAVSSANPRIIHSQLLAVPKHKLNLHPVRRLAGLTPSFAQDLIICPTCDERIIAISAQDHSVRWIFRYDDNIVIQDRGGQFPVLAGSRDPMHSEAVDLDTRWVDSLPRIIGNRILITPRDANDLLCLDLDSGSELWRLNRGLSRCIAAVTPDLVVLSGNKQVMAVNLEDGKTVWSGQILKGQVCGTGLCDGRILQLPTSAPSIESFEIATGRRLLSQRLTTRNVPGNLMSIDDRVVWQNLTSVTATDADLTTRLTTPADRATALLLQADPAQATDLLEDSVATSPDDPATRELLIDVLLESLRMDYSAASSSVPRLRELIGRKSVRTEDLTPLIESMLGMSLNDAAVFPMRYEALNRSERHMDQLFELVANGLIDSRDASVQDLTVAIGNMLPILRSSQERVTTTGFLSRRNAFLLAAGVRRLIELRTAEEAAELQVQLAQLLKQELSDVSFEQGIQLARVLQFAGLLDMALSATNQLSASNELQKRRQQALLEQLRIDAATGLRGPSAENALTSLLESWQQQLAHDSIVAIHDDLTETTSSAENTLLGFRCADPDAAAAALRATAEFVQAVRDEPSRRIWQGMPDVKVSDDRTMLPKTGDVVVMPQFAVPLFGDPRLYRDWSFVQETGTRSVVAFDGSGRRRWQFDPEVTVSPIRSGRLQESYILASGHVLAIKLQDNLYLVDATTASLDQPPAPLWDVDLAALNRDEESRIFHQYTPSSEGIHQYAPAPAGHFPVGPLNNRAIPVLAGRRLIVFDPVTGDPLWQLNGLALDTVLLGNDQRVLLVSESSRQVESRDLGSGELLNVSGLPRWWSEAEVNVAMSVRDVELEAGSEVIWRAGVFRDRCLLFRLSPDKAVLELRTPADDGVVWSKEFPVDTVFSNTVGRTIALLCNGNQLRLLRIDTGDEQCQLEVAAVAPARNLYLRASGNRWLVLPEARDDEDPSLEELDLVMNSMHVHGQLYAIDRSTLKLAWQRPIQHLFIRQTIPNQSPILSSAPILVLVSRYRKQNEFTFSSHMRAHVFDVETGNPVYDSGAIGDPNYVDLGRTLNGHGLFIDAENQTLMLGFETRDVTFTYSKPSE
jgi:outer membrane protein assembly factor BamB